MQEEFERLGQEVAAQDAATAPAKGLVEIKEPPEQAIAEVEAILAANGL